MKNPLRSEIALKFPASSDFVELLTGVAFIIIILYIATTNQQPMLVECFINIKIDESKILPEYDLFYFLADQAIGSSCCWSSQGSQHFWKIHQSSSALHSKIMKGTKLNVAGKPLVEFSTVLVAFPHSLQFSLITFTIFALESHLVVIYEWQ